MGYILTLTYSSLFNLCEMKKKGWIRQRYLDMTFFLMSTFFVKEVVKIFCV